MPATKSLKMDTESKIKFRFDWLLTGAVIAHLPMGIEYYFRMWRTGHYKFFPFLLLIVGWLIYERVAQLPAIGKRSRTTYPLLFVNAALLISSILFYSSTIWMLSFLFLVAVVIYDRFGLKGCMTSFPAWALLLFIFPLPGGTDLLLINKLQFLASQMASWVLDSVRLIHFREGVVLITEKKQFFAEEACSGVRSLFSSTAAISVLGVYLSYPWWRLIFNLIQTTIWVLVGNALRIATVVYVADSWTDSIASGPAHELLGLGVFLFIFVLALSTDRTLGLFFESSLKGRSNANAEDSVQEKLFAKWFSSPTSNRKFNLAMSIMFIAVTLFSSRLTYAKFSNEHLRQGAFANRNMSPLTIDALPVDINGWQRISFEQKVRNEHSLLAPESFLWTYENAGLTAVISLDGPYQEFHNLSRCYDGLGWTTSCTHSYQGSSLASLGNRSKLIMQKKDQRGIVLFTAIDRNGNLVLPNESFYVGSRLGAVAQNIALAFGMTVPADASSVLNSGLPISQIQLLAQSAEVANNSDQLEELFVAAREILRQSPRFSN